MALPFKLFVGGKIGSGEQGVSWVHLDDAVAALTLCIDDEAMPAKVNVCSPNPASNAEISTAIAAALRRPNWLPAPSVGMKMLFGEGAEPILTGQYAVPAVLAPKLSFTKPTLTDAVRHGLGKTSQS
jgi:NAD dependent epimerase/dehydratase family enzyme